MLRPCEAFYDTLPGFYEERCPQRERVKRVSARTPDEGKKGVKRWFSDPRAGNVLFDGPVIVVSVGYEPDRVDDCAWRRVLSFDVQQ